MNAIRCPKCYEENVGAYNVYSYAICNVCGKNFTRFDEARDIFYQLWRLSQNSPDYNKKLWGRLRELLGL